MGRLGLPIPSAALVRADAAGAGTAAGVSSGVTLELRGHRGGVVRAVALAGDSLWMGEGIGVTQVDVADPSRASAGRHVVLGLNADVYSLERLGDFLYIGARDGVHVVHLAAVGGPVPVAHFGTPGTVRAITAYQPPGGGPDLLFLSDDDAGVLLAEANGAILTVTRAIESTGGARAPTAFFRDLALVPGDGLHVVSLANPAAPVELACLATRGPVRGVAAAASGAPIAYVSDGTDGLLAVDLTNPALPSITGRLAGAPVGGLNAWGRWLLVIDDGIHLVETAEADPTQMTYIGYYPELAGTLDLVRSGNLLVAARGDTLSVTAIEASEPRRQPRLLVDLQATSPLRQLAQIGDFVFVARGALGLNVLSVADPAAVETVASYAPPWGVYGVRVHRGRAYLSTDRGIETWDVSDPGEPAQLAGPFAAWAATPWIAASGQWLVSTTTEWLHVAQIGAGGLPSAVGEFEYAAEPTWPLGAIPQGVALVDGPVAYVAAGSTGVVLVDLVRPDRPTVHTVVPAPGGADALSVAAAAGQLFVGTSDGVAVYDIAIPKSPQLEGRSLGGSAARAMAIDGQRLYVATDVGGIQVLDVADPAVPVLVGQLRLDYPIGDIAAAGARLYAAGAGLLILGVEPPPGATPPPTPPTVVPTTPATPPPTRPPTVVPRPSPTTTPSPTATVPRTGTPTLTPTTTVTPVRARIYYALILQWQAD